MQYGFYIDQHRCSGCFACVVACKDWHDIPAGPASRLRLKTMEKGTCPNIFVSFLPTTCYHCKEPVCVFACPNDAIAKRKEDGIVVVNRDECMGIDSCGMCFDECPYDAPQFGTEEDAKMDKCDLCVDRWALDKRPVCVIACPMLALDAGPIEELIAKYGDTRGTEGFELDKTLAPSIIFNPKNDTADLALKRIEIKPELRSNR